MTSNDDVASMTVNNQEPQPTELQVLLSLGFRAAWLHMTITGPRGGALTPRDREILTLVATAGPFGIAQPTLVEEAAALAVSGPAALRRAQQLAAQGLLSIRPADSLPCVRFDLPEADLRWIHGQVMRLSGGE